jgi:glutamine synthetase
VRVPVNKQGKPNSTRLEYRAPDSAANPYLAFAVILAAGLAGIEGNYELPIEAEGNLFSLEPSTLTKQGIAPLPGNLNDAVDAMEQSDLVRNTLGEHLFEWFIRNKRAEWSDYKSEVTKFELDRYLPRL